MQPDVSVVIPTYNRRGFLEQAIQSCFAENDAVDVEVIVVDDGSTDDTRDYLRALSDERVRTFLQENQGASAARNRGMDEARGTSIKFLDDDDYLLPGALHTQHEALQANGVEVCYGDFHFQFESGKPGWRFTNGTHRYLFTGLAHGGVKRFPFLYLFRRPAISRVHWNETLDYLEDIDFMLRASSRRLACTKVREPVAVHRIHDGERLSDLPDQDPTAPQLNLKCEMYWNVYQQLSHGEPLNEPFRTAAATGLWREAYKLAAFDFKSFEHWYKKMRTIKADFLPSRSNAILGTLDKLMSPGHTERLIRPFRQAKVRFQRLRD